MREKKGEVCLVPGPKRVVLYRDFGIEDLPTLKQVVAEGAEAACLTADGAALKRANGTVRFLGPPTVPGFLDFWEVLEPDVFLRLVEALYDRLVSGSPLLRWLRRLYGSLDIDLYFRRVFLNELGQLLSAAAVISSPPLDEYATVTLARDWPSSPLQPVILSVLLQGNAHEGLASRLPPPIRDALERLSLAGGPRSGMVGMARRLARPVYHVARTWYWAMGRLRPQGCRLAPGRLILRTYATDWGVDSDGCERLRNVDFVVDGSELCVEDVVIWAEAGVSEERVKALRQRGYRVICADDLVINFSAFARRVIPVIFSYAALLPILVREGRWWYAHVADLVSTFLLWQEVCQQVKPAVFLGYNDLWATAVARDIVLRQYGCRSVFYQHSCNHPVIRGECWPPWRPFLVFDTVAIWGQEYRKLFRLSTISDFWQVGCLWSEHARLVRDDSKLNKRYSEHLAFHASNSLDRYRRRIGVFDTSVSGMLSISDLVGLYAGVLRLAQRLPEVLFLCKPKFPLGDILAREGEFGGRVLRDIEQAPNVVLLPNYFETAAVIGLTDLAIGACFTSTTVEAIGCGKRAIYYDPLDRLPEAFWRRMPGMVCITDEELYERVCYLLWECDDETYMDYLRTHCRGVEGRFDGRGITRLRRRLLAVMNGRGSAITADG